MWIPGSPWSVINTEHLINLSRLYRSRWFILLLLCLGSLLLYWSIPGRSFASDDFLVMRRVGMDGVIWIKGFFRPLSDITLRFNYLIDGFSPRGYYLFNILMHGVNAYLLYCFCRWWKWTGDGEMQRRCALLAALLFLCYPFHNECIDYVLGRASLTASFFGMAALVAVVSGLPKAVRIFLCCLFYFIGMGGYESVMLLPLIVMIIIYGKETPFGEYVYWASALAVTLAIHIAVRMIVAGVLTGEYGSQFLGSRLLHYGGNVFRTAERFFLPPMESVPVIVLLFFLVVVLLAAAIVLFVRKFRSDSGARSHLLKILLVLVIASAVPILAGVSTHTSESDRFIYFPSYFLCAGVALLLMGLPGKKWLWVAGIIILCYECIFLEKNNSNWVKASGITREVLSAIEGNLSAGRVFVVNLPDEKDGAYIFRLGLPDALIMDGKDTSRLVVVSHLTRDVERSIRYPLRVSERGGEVRMPPEAVIRREGADSFQISAGDGVVRRGGKGDIVLYWDGQRVLGWTPGRPK